MASVSALKGTTQGEDNFLPVNNVISSLDFKLDKLIDVTTDGARNMTAKILGCRLLLLIKLKELSLPLFFHYIIHQHEL